MDKLPRFNDPQLKQMRRLIRNHCCNFHNGNCYALDDGIDPSCAQWNAYSLQCIWFRNCILPMNRDLQESVLGISSQYKQCLLCHKYFIPTGNRSIYCPLCAYEQRKAKTRERVRRYRLQL